jgi:hypothetical protein
MDGARPMMMDGARPMMNAAIPGSSGWLDSRHPRFPGTPRFLGRLEIGRGRLVPVVVLGGF